jgi:ribonuclease BN (tRNA processing enzyme)
MRLQILGCGTIIQQDSAYNCSGYLVDQSLLFDCGPGIWRALHQQRVPLLQIEHIFLSHFHLDHCADLAPILQENYLTDPEGERCFNLYGPKGLHDWFDRFTAFLGKWAGDIPVYLHECDRQVISLAGYHITSGTTGHTENSLCYRLEKGSKYFFYSGDTGYHENVVSQAADCHLAVIEASHSVDTKMEGHLTPELAATIAARASVKKLCLTHMYPEVRKGNPQRLAARCFNGEIYLAEDGLQIEF